MSRALATPPVVPFVCGAFVMQQAHEHHLHYVTANLREKDKSELVYLEALGGSVCAAQQVLAQSFVASTLRFTLMHGNKCLGLGGLAPVSKGENPCFSPWLVGTHFLDHFPKAFGVVARFYRRVLFKHFPRLLNVTAAPAGQQNPPAVRWLAGMGFTVCRLPPLPLPRQEELCAITKEWEGAYVFYTL